MKKIKITILALGVCFAVSDLAAQDTKPSSSTEVVINPKEVALKNVKNDVGEISAALKIKDEKRLSYIASALSQYEVALAKTMASDKTAEHKAKAKEDLEMGRDKRLSALLDPSELKLYTKWKESKEEEDAVLENKPKESMGTGSKAAVKK
ncbi:MAG: hypothetical protein QMB45_02130 [Flavobacteriales bacterium]|jgi:hypothetical protein